MRHPQKLFVTYQAACWVTHEYRVEGPVMILLTTTAVEVDEELLNRCIVLTVDEDREQTRAIHRLQRERQTLEGLLAKRDRDHILAVHRNAQRLLRPVHVTNPFARELTFLDDQTRTRRDHLKYLTLIRSIALLHQYQRPTKSVSHQGQAVQYIEATIDDIAAANALAHEALGRSLDELAPQTRRLLMLIDEMVTESCQQLSIERSDHRFSRRQVRETTGWGNTQLKLHLHRLEELEYLLLHRGGRGHSFVYELLYDGNGKDGKPFLCGLIEVDKLQGNHNYDLDRSGLAAEWSGPSRAEVGRVSGGGRVESTVAAKNVNLEIEASSLETSLLGTTEPAKSYVAAGRKRMPRRGHKSKRTAVGDVTDPRGMARLSSAHLEWMRVQNYSEQTVKGREKHLRRFTVWCEERSITRPTDVTKPILERYARWLYHHRKDDGRPLSFGSQYGQLMGVRMFFRWLARQNHILSNPASELELPRRERRLPKHVLTIQESEAVINQPDVNDPLGVRDRAMLETFYSTGMRRMELVGLKIFDLDFERGTVLIRQGKGKKDRMIPIGDRALVWTEKYLREVRCSLVVEPDDGSLFLTKDGTPLIADHLSSLVKRYVEASNIGKTGACHLFRHTMATLMLEGGADVRYIQQMLGHSRLETTEVYTHVSIRTLKAVHTATHPARLQRASSEPKLLPPAVAHTSVCENESRHVVAESIDNDENDRRAELLLSLAAEATEEEHSLAASHFAS